MVWGTLVASMTLVGGGLYVANGGTVRGASSAGVRPMMATAVQSDSSGELDAIFRVPRPLDAQRWQAIVIHDSGDTVGSPASLDRQARANGLKSLGYHFVVGNGAGLKDGWVFVSSRWQDQQPGAHAAGKDADWFNRQAIGVCLVGDGDRQRFSAAQTRQTVQLVQTLCARFNIPPERVYLHSQIAPTSSPGKHFPEARLRAALQRR